MRAQEPDAVAARALFTELEFTTLVQDFLTESIELGETDYREAKSAADVEALIVQARKPGAVLAIALESSASLQSAAEEDESADEEESEQLSLIGCAAGITCTSGFAGARSPREAGKALTLALDDSETAGPLKQALADESIPKDHSRLQIRDACPRPARNVTLAGVQHDPLLYAYLLDPTYSTYGLRETAFRKFSLKLAGHRRPKPPTSLAPDGETAR